MQQKTDTQLVALARAGRKQAFGQLIDRHGTRARRLARDIVGDQDAAQELAQEAFVQAYLSLEHLRDGAHFGSWLGGIVFNVCRSHLRERQTARRMASGLTILAAPDPQTVAEERERRRLITEAIETLSPENRAATRLFYYDQRSVKEIAALLGVSVIAVKGRLHKSRQQLKTRLLPLYPHWEQVLPSKPRRKRMVRVTVSGVYMHQQEDKPAHHFLKLADEAGREMQIWIGQPEAFAITYALEKAPTERPMTIDLLVSFIREAGATLEEIRIEALKQETFYAVLKVRFPDGTREMDARPSDAIALALRSGSPIFVTSDVMEQAPNKFLPEQATGESGQSPAVLIAPTSTDEAALRGLAEAILRQGIINDADEITFGFGPSQAGVHVFYRVGDTCENSPAFPVLTRNLFSLLVQRFKIMADMINASGKAVSEEGHIPIRYAGRDHEAKVRAGTSEYGEMVTIRLKRDIVRPLNTEDYSDEEAIRRLSSAILGQALREGAHEIVFGLGRFVSAEIDPNNPSASRIYFEIEPAPEEVHVLFRGEGEWQDTMTLPKAALKPLVARFMVMSTTGEPMWHVPIAFQDKMYDAHVTVKPGQHGEGVHIALKPESPK